jgi:predicted lipoprotein with Yx(FWY)xxD motif
MRAKSILAVAAVLSLALSAAAYAASAPDGVKTAKIDSGTVYVDAKGMTLYTFDNDTTPDKSMCNDRCAMAWPPLAAAADAKAKGDWTVITRDDGTKQWAYKGKPLYTFSRDVAPGDAKGDNVGPNGTHIWHAVPAG